MFNLPNAVLDFFQITPLGFVAARMTSPSAVYTIERCLAEEQISYRTRIVKSRRNGLHYVITILSDVLYES